jgi:hypothetical protein
MAGQQVCWSAGTIPDFHPGKNGCIPDCGANIVIGDAPVNYINIGYFEA